MNHDHCSDCKHEVAYCEKCKVVYCKKCGKEWGASENPVYPVYPFYPVPYIPQYPPMGPSWTTPTTRDPMPWESPTTIC